jgi:hypothetical protein
LCWTRFRSSWRPSSIKFNSSYESYCSKLLNYKNEKDENITWLANFPIVFLNIHGAKKGFSSYHNCLSNLAYAIASWPFAPRGFL